MRGAGLLAVTVNLFLHPHSHHPLTPGTVHTVFQVKIKVEGSTVREARAELVRCVSGGAVGIRHQAPGLLARSPRPRPPTAAATLFSCPDMALLRNTLPPEVYPLHPGGDWVLIHQALGSAATCPSHAARCWHSESQGLSQWNCGSVGSLPQGLPCPPVSHRR